MNGLSRWGRLALAFLLIVSVGGITRAEDESPSEQEVAQAIRRGVAFLRGAQQDDGTWEFTFMHQHRLGMTALAGLALLENGVPADDPTIVGARRAIESLS